MNDLHRTIRTEIENHVKDWYFPRVGKTMSIGVSPTVSYDLDVLLDPKAGIYLKHDGKTFPLSDIASLVAYLVVKYSTEKDQNEPHLRTRLPESLMLLGMLSTLEKHPNCRGVALGSTLTSCCSECPRFSRGVLVTTNRTDEHGHNRIFLVAHVDDCYWIRLRNRTIVKARTVDSALQLLQELLTADVV